MAARCARRVGRLDWWNVLQDFTPEEIANIRAMEIAEPDGEERADLRFAINTLAVVNAVSLEEDLEKRREINSQIGEQLLNYCKPMEETPEPPKPNKPMHADVFAAVLRASFGGYRKYDTR